MGKQCQDLLNNVHKKYNTVYQQILRLLERIHSKSALRANYISKINTLKQMQSVPNIIDDIKLSLKTLHQDFDPFISQKNENNKDDINHFKDAFRAEIASSAERRRYRLLQKSCRLERISILLTKLCAIFKQNELNKHCLIQNHKKMFEILKNRFYKELENIFLSSIRSGSLLSLRSNLRCYNYLNGDIKPESIVRVNFIAPTICATVPISLFAHRRQQNRED